MDEKEKEELLKKIEEYSKKIEEDFNNASNYYNRGFTYFLLKKYEEAINDYNKAVELNPNNASYYFSRGSNYYFLNRYNEAIEDYSKAIELDPNNASYFNSRGVAYRDLENYQEAINNYDRAIELDPNNAFYFNSRGDIYYYEKSYEKAIDDYDKAIKLDSSNASYYDNRGLAYDNLGEYNKAINDYDRAIKLDPNYAFYYYNRGFAYSKLKKYKEAIEDYNKAIELDPNNASYFNSRGVAYNNLGEYSKAIDDYDKAIKLNPNYTFAYNNKGITFDNLGEFEEAITNYNKAIELDPSYKSAIENRNFSLKELENFRKNNQKSRNNSKIDEISESKYQTDFNNAKALHLQGEIDDNFKKAEKEFSNFINKYKDSQNKSPALENLLTEAASYLVASKFKVKRFMGYLTFADILGWKGIWQKQNTPKGKVNYAESLFSIKNSLKTKFNNEKNFYNINLISDTFVIFSEDFKQSNELSKNLIEQCLEKGLLIRGATSYGECYNKDMVYVGQAVDEAASWHEKGEEIGIFYTSSARLSINLSDLELEKYHLKNDEVNTKNGKIKTYFINWYNETTEKRFYEIMIKEIIFPEISLKYFNTENRLKKILHSEEVEKK